MCVQVVRRADVGRAEVRWSTGLRAERRAIEPTYEPPRRLRQTSTGVPQLTNSLDDLATKFRGTTNASDHNTCDNEISHAYGLLYAPNPVFLGVHVRVSAVQYPYDPLPFILESK